MAPADSDGPREEVVLSEGVTEVVVLSVLLRLAVRQAVALTLRLTVALLLRELHAVAEGEVVPEMESEGETKSTHNTRQPTLIVLVASAATAIAGIAATVCTG